VISFPQISPPELCMHLSISQSFYIPRPSHPRSYCRNNIRIIQIVKIVVTTFINVSYSEAHRFKNFFVGILLDQVFFFLSLLLKEILFRNHSDALFLFPTTHHFHDYFFEFKLLPGFLR
jgi:hypothetical protein